MEREVDEDVWVLPVPAETNANVSAASSTLDNLDGVSVSFKGSKRNKAGTGNHVLITTTIL